MSASSTGHPLNSLHPLAGSAFGEEHPKQCPKQCQPCAVRSSSFLPTAFSSHYQPYLHSKAAHAAPQQPGPLTKANPPICIPAPTKPPTSTSASANHPPICTSAPTRPSSPLHPPNHPPTHQHLSIDKSPTHLHLCTHKATHPPTSISAPSSACAMSSAISCSSRSYAAAPLPPLAALPAHGPHGDATSEKTVNACSAAACCERRG